MRVEMYTPMPGFIEREPRLVFSKAEQAAMRKVAAIMAEARGLCARRFDDWADCDVDYLLAHAEHACADLLDAGGLMISR